MLLHTAFQMFVNFFKSHSGKTVKIGSKSVCFSNLLNISTKINTQIT